jgi:hypothetical protein
VVKEEINKVKTRVNPSCIWNGLMGFVF